MKAYSLNINGIDYAFTEAGNGPLLLLAHGTFGGMRLLLPQLEHLSRKYRCVAFDWRGHGGSGYTPGGWTADDLVEDVAAIITALGEDRAAMAGVSQGGAIAMRVALKYPGKLRALVNMCGGPGGPSPEAVKGLYAFASTLAEEKNDILRRQAAVDFARGYFHAPGFIEAEPERFAEEIDVMLSHPRDSVGLLPCVAESYVDITPRLKAVACPTLILWGEKELRPDMGAELASMIPSAELKVIANAGHHINVDAPEQASLCIEDFLSRRMS